MSKSSMFLFGALGGLLPILASLLTIDVAGIIDHRDLLTPGNYIGYGIRVSVLLFLGGVMAILNDVKQPLALVQLGISAPALITAYINSAPLTNQTAATQHTAMSISIVSTAQAEELAAAPRIRLAGGLLSDVINGASGRLDAVARDNQLSKNPNLVYPNNASSHVGTGTFCSTSAGRFGPGPANPVGQPCTVPMPNGPMTGIVTQ